MRKYKYSEQTIQDVKVFSNDDGKIVKYALESNHQMLRDLVDLRIKQYSLQVSMKKGMLERLSASRQGRINIDVKSKDVLWAEIDELQDKIFLGYNIIEQTYDAVNKEFINQMKKAAMIHRVYDNKKDNRQKFGETLNKKQKNTTREI